MCFGTVHFEQRTSTKQLYDVEVQYLWAILRFIGKFLFWTSSKWAHIVVCSPNRHRDCVVCFDLCFYLLTYTISHSKIFDAVFFFQLRYKGNRRLLIRKTTMKKYSPINRYFLEYLYVEDVGFIFSHWQRKNISMRLKYPPSNDVEGSMKQTRKKVMRLISISQTKLSSNARPTMFERLNVKMQESHLHKCNFTTIDRKSFAFCSPMQMEQE